MAKKKIKLKNLGKQHIKDQLIRLHPFLKKEYRELKKDELNSPEVFAELFGDSVRFEAFRLVAIYELQK